MALKREQKTILKLAAVTLVFTGALLAALRPFVGMRQDPTLSFATILTVEALLFGASFWIAGKDSRR